VDFSDWRSLREKVAKEIEARGPIVVLVNNTGGPPPGPAYEAEPESFAAGFELHLLANQGLVQTLLPGMMEEGYARIVNIISSSVITPIPNLGVSNTVRGAVAQWGKTLAAELAPHGITVNNILPGSIETERLRAFMSSLAEATNRTPAEVEERTLAAIPAGRLGQPSEIGEVVAFLASPAASYVTGVNLPVDGGRLAVQ
ncbi:MAG: SDR family oxidoreductase, partial [Acidimicrobiia bacterium]